MHCAPCAPSRSLPDITRFLVLGRNGVVQHLHKKIPSKTLLVFMLPDIAGALFKSLAYFSLRDIDMSKIKSRPMSAALLNYLRFRNTVTRSSAKLPRRAALSLLLLPGHHLVGAQRGRPERAAPPARAEQFLPRPGLVPRQVAAVEVLNTANAGKPRAADLRLEALPSDVEEAVPLSKTMSPQHKVRCVDVVDKSKEAECRRARDGPRVALAHLPCAQPRPRRDPTRRPPPRRTTASSARRP